MAKKRRILDLGARERQIYEAVLRCGEGSVSDISNAIPESPGMTIVRATLGELVKKGLVEYRNIKNRYFYKSKTTIEAARRSVLSDVMAGLFGGKPTDVAVTLFEVAGRSIPLDDLEALSNLIEKTRRERLETQKDDGDAVAADPEAKGGTQ